MLQDSLCWDMCILKSTNCFLLLFIERYRGTVVHLNHSIVYWCHCCGNSLLVLSYLSYLFCITMLKSWWLGILLVTQPLGIIGHWKMWLYLHSHFPLWDVNGLTNYYHARFLYLVSFGCRFSCWWSCHIDNYYFSRWSDKVGC